MKLPGLPRKVLLVPSNNIHIEVVEAIRLVAIRRAREVYSQGQFVGIELGHFGPVPTEPHAEPLPPAEIENTRFVLPSADRTHSFIMSLALAGCPGYAEFA